MTIPIAITWLLGGLIAGLLAALVVGGSRFGVRGDLLFGMAGGFVGSWGFRELGWVPPFAETVGPVVVAFAGGVVVLVVMHLLERVTRIHSL